MNGVTVMVVERVEKLLLTAEKGRMVPEPAAANPIDVVELVQL